MKLFYLTALSFLLAACAPQPRNQADLSELASYSVVAVTDPSFAPSQGERISWIADVIFVGSDDQETPATLEQQIRADINQQLATKGYALAQGPEVEYRIVAVLQTGSEKLSDEMRELFRLYPSLGDTHSAEQGMLIVALARPGNTEALWRGGIKVFLDEARLLSAEQRAKRVQLAVAKVMASLPRAL